MKPGVVHFYFAISGTLFDAIDIIRPDSLEHISRPTRQRMRTRHFFLNRSSLSDKVTTQTNLTFPLLKMYPEPQLRHR
jgi:hypothetical protein